MSSAPRPIRLYESTIPSGNAYKVRLLMSHLGQEIDVQELDILARPSETRRPEFLAMNPNGRIPVVELADGSYLAESNAILSYIAEGTQYLPEGGLERARALSWLFFEQYSHERFVAVLKFWTFWGGLHNRREDEVAEWKRRGQEALQVMDTHLASHPFFTGSRYGVADIALFAYSQSAGDVGFDLGELDHLRAWLDRVRDQPGYVPMKPDPLAKAPDCH